ncbi:hypothetical protein Tco_0947020 [Tanacetum coccineum]
MGLQVKQQPDGIFISQDKYVADILKKFDFCSIKTATTLIVSNKPLVKDEDGVDVDVHVYRSMIGSLMYLAAFRPDIMFAVYACARFQVTPKASHLNVVKRIFRYLKHQPKLRLWYPRDSPFELEAFSDSDYGGASLDRKSTTGEASQQITLLLRATYGVELVSAASLVNTARPTLSTARLGKFGAVRQIWCCQANLMLSGKFGAARQIWCCQAKVFSMANLEFVDQHNMVACLEKTEGNSDFHEIVDFLASSLIHHALTVSPPIYTSYIEQFWNTASSQTVNDVKQINATVDSKAVVVTEASIRSSLLFNDADGTACLTNEAIFQNLALMGYEGDFNKLTFQKALFSPQWKFLIHTILHCLSSKSTSWNEFSTNIASAVICLATNQKFNFSKLIFDGMLRNLDNTKKKFLMYPRFLMVFLNNQIELGEPFNDVYPTPAHNLKVFTNMSRKGLKFSGKITPLFPNMLTHAAEGEGSGEPTEPQPTPSPTQPSTGDQPPETSSSHATTQDSRDSLEGTNGNEGDQVQTPHDSPLSGGHTSDRAEGALNLQELSVLCTNLSNRVLALESIKDAQAAEISALKSRIKKLEKKCKPSISHHRAWLKSVSCTRYHMSRSQVWNNHGKLRKLLMRGGKVLKLKRVSVDLMLQKLRKTWTVVIKEEMLKNYGVPHDYYRVFRSNESSRYIKTFIEMVLRFDRLDFIELHSLVMQRFSTTTLEGIDLVLWGDLRIMFEETTDDDIWKNQEKWIIKSWTLYENCGVHILALEDGTKIHMLVERRYPLIRETLERMMELRLTTESESEAIFDLLRFIQKQIDKFGDQDGSEKDL